MYNSIIEFIEKDTTKIEKITKDFLLAGNTLRFEEGLRDALIELERNIYQAIEKSQRLKNRPLNEAMSMSEVEDQASSKDIHLDPADIMIGKERAGVLRKKISESLSKMENQVLDMFLEGKDYREIAELTGREPKSIDNALQRIRQKVKALLNRE